MGLAVTNTQKTT